MQKLDLDGLWEFFYTPQKFEGTGDLPDKSKFTGRMVTPGYWDDHYELFDEEDFFSLRARFNPDYRKPHFPAGTTLLPHASSSFLIGTGFYRKQVLLELSGDQLVFLTVGPAMWGCCVFCNGKNAGKVTGYSVSTEFEITPFVHSGKLNEIIIAVCNCHDDGGAYCRLDGSHDGLPFGTRPGQHRGLAAQGYQSERAGIGDHTYIRLSGKSAITDSWITFECGKPHWHAELKNGKGASLRGGWSFETAGGTVLAKGEFAADNMEPGTIVTLCKISLDLPEVSAGERCILRTCGKVNGTPLENHWDFWVFPAKETAPSGFCHIADKLTDELVDYAVSGGAVLLTGGFPSETRKETFRSHTSGRSLGHSGALLNPHPIWARFPHQGFLDWQFYPVMKGSTSMIYDDAMPEFRPIMELIPSFKLIRYKSMLSEFKVGAGRMMMTGLVLSDDEPAGRFLKKELVDYLSGHDYADAPAWEPEELKKRLRQCPIGSRKEIAVDAGGRPVEAI